MGSVSISEEVNNGSVGKGLLDITVSKMDYGVAIREALPFDSIVENNFFFAVGEHTLNLIITVYYIPCHRHQHSN